MNLTWRSHAIDFFCDLLEHHNETLEELANIEVCAWSNFSQGNDEETQTKLNKVVHDDGLGLPSRTGY